MLPAGKPEPDASFLGASILRALDIDPDALSRYQRLVVTVAVLFVGGMVGWSLLDVLRYPGIDFRNRVVGARVLMRGQNPYQFIWQDGLPEELLDPTYSEIEPLPRVSVPPTVIVLYGLVAWLPYRALRVLSWGLEWSAMFWSVALLARLVPERRWRLLFLLVAAYFFLLSDFWRLHVERGQVYVFHLLFLALGASWCCRDGLDSWRGGAALGLAIAIRPSLLLLAPAFFALGRWRTTLAILGSAALAVLATLPLAPPSYWQIFSQVGDNCYRIVWQPEAVPRLPPPPPVSDVEGYNYAKSLGGNFRTELCVIYQVGLVGFGAPVVDIGLVCKSLFAAWTLLLLALLFWKRQQRSTRLTLGLIFIFLVASEYFLPRRWNYVDIMYLLPLALLLPTLRQSLRINSLPAVLVLAGLVLGNLLVGYEDPWLQTLARSSLLASGLMIAALSAWVGIPRTGDSMS